MLLYLNTIYVVAFVLELNSVVDDYVFIEFAVLGCQTLQLKDLRMQLFLTMQRISQNAVESWHLWSRKYHDRIDQATNEQ